MMKKKRLRSGFTTGACAAAAAKAACELLLTGEASSSVSIPFPDGKHISFKIHQSSMEDEHTATASIIKDAGDDPDVTNGAEIIAMVHFEGSRCKQEPPKGVSTHISLLAGDGVGTVTKPGLEVDVGQPAINPVPRQMIYKAVTEALNTAGKNAVSSSCSAEELTITLSIANGEELAKKTLNHRLGIIGGLSILGTTGIVKPISAQAWTATINASMSVAIKSGTQEIVISTGRTSEKGVQKILNLPIESYAMMGDYLEFSLLAAREHGFTKIHLAAMWAKILKAAMQIPQTHVRHGALDPEKAAAFIGELTGNDHLVHLLSGSNTAREIYGRLLSAGENDAVKLVCRAAKAFSSEIAGLQVEVYLVNSACKVVEHV